MSTFKQETMDYTIKYINGEFYCNLESLSGESELYDGNLYSKPCKSSLDANEIFANYNYQYFNNLREILKLVRNSLLKINKEFTAFIKLHGEYIKVSNNIEDFREFGFCRLIYKDEKNSYVQEVPIVDNNIESIKNRIFEVTEKNIKKLKSDAYVKTIKYDEIPIILSPSASGYFIHEIIGHMLEEEVFTNSDNILKKQDFEISDKLNVTDSVTGYEKYVGLSKYDDNGIKIMPIKLIEEGKINNIIAVDKTKSFDNRLYGMARRQSYKHLPLARMRFTFINPIGKLNRDKIIEKYNNALFIDKLYAGNVIHFNGVYTLFGNGYVVQDGELKNLVNNIKITGDVVKDLNNIEYIGNDFDVTIGECFKFGQIVRVCTGGPTLSLKSANIEGMTYE